MPQATRTRLHRLFGTSIAFGAAALLVLAPTAALARDRGAHAEPSKSQKVTEENPDDPLAGIDLDNSVGAPSKNKGRKSPAPSTDRKPGHK